MAISKDPSHPYITLTTKSPERRYGPEAEVHDPKMFKILEEQKATKLRKGSMTLLKMKPLSNRRKKKISASPKKR